LAPSGNFCHRFARCRVSITGWPFGTPWKGRPFRKHTQIKRPSQPVSPQVTGLFIGPVDAFSSCFGIVVAPWDRGRRWRYALVKGAPISTPSGPCRTPNELAPGWHAVRLRPRAHIMRRGFQPGEEASSGKGPAAAPSGFAPRSGGISNFIDAPRGGRSLERHRAVGIDRLGERAEYGAQGTSWRLRFRALWWPSGWIA